MNLTKWFAASLCLTAMTVSAGFIKTNAFEDDVSTGWWVGEGNTLSSWSVANDSVNGRSSYGGARPMPDAANANVLKLDTDGNVWTNTINQSFAVAPVWADMLVKFVPSEELPSLTNEDGKLALAIKAGVGGTNYLNVGNNNGTIINWSETTREISTSAWYRVTVKMFTIDDYAYADVLINGTPISLQLPMDGNLVCNSIGFQGTGYIDEVTVGDGDPIATSILLTLSFATGIDSVYVGETQKTTGQTVTSGDTLIITASTWKQIATLTGPSTITWVAGGLGSSVATVTVANASATTVEIAAQTVTNTTATAGSGTSFDGAPMNKVATWALANSVTVLTSDMYDRYLFDIAEDATVPTMLITSMTISGSTVTVVVTAGTANLKTGINGTLKIRSYATLGATPTVRTIAFVGATTDTITCDIGTDKFVRATVE